MQEFFGIKDESLRNYRVRSHCPVSVTFFQGCRSTSVGISPRRKQSSRGANRSRSGFSGGRPSRKLARNAALTEAALPIDPTLRLANRSNGGLNVNLPLAG